MRPGIPRSILYTPALRMDRLQAARECDADLFLIDLEDSVPPERKASGRALCVEFLNGLAGAGRTAVRVNEMGSAEYVRDMAALLQAHQFPGFVFMTMVRSAREPELLRSQLHHAGHSPDIYITVETIEALTDLDEIAADCDGMILGSADLGATLGVEITWNNMLYARQKMAHACARHEIGCIDTGCFRVNDVEELCRESEAAKDLGFHGKGTVHPKQLAEINRVFRPNPEEVRRAQEVLDASAANRSEVSLLRGGLIGPPFVKKARKVLEMSSAWEQRFRAR